MITVFLSFLSPFLGQLLANPYSWNSKHSEKAFQDGIEAVFNYDLNKADKSFDDLVTFEPDRPEGYYYKSYAYFWRYFFGERKEDYKTFIKLNDIAIQKTERYLQKNEGIPYREAMGHFFLGESYLYRASVEARAGNFISSGWNATKSRGNYEEALIKHPDFHDAKKGVGMLQFITSLVPPSLQWIVRALGYKGNRQEGLNMMREAEKKGYYTTKEVHFYLTIIDFYFYKKKTATENELKNLLKKSPKSSIYLYSLGYLYYSKGLSDDAITYLKRVIKNFDRHPHDAFGLYSLYLLGDVYFKKNDFKTALHYLNLNPDLGNLEFFSGRFYYKKGLCYEFLGERKKAVQAYKACKIHIDVISGEVYAKRKAREYISTPLSNDEKNLILLYNSILSRNIEMAASYAKKLDEKITRLSIDKKAMLYYYKGMLSQIRGEMNNALVFYRRATSFFPKRERHIPPHSYLAIGKLHMGKGDYQETEKALIRAERYSAYDYEVTIRREVSLLRDRINQMKK